MEILFLISLAYGVAITVLLRRFYHIFFVDCSVSAGTEWGLYGILFVLSLATFFLFHHIYWLYFVINVTLKYLLSLIYLGSHKKRLSLALMFVLVTSAVEMILAILMLPITVEPNSPKLYYPFYFVAPLFNAIFMYAFVFIMEGVRSNKTGIHFPVKYWGCFIATPLLTVFLMEAVMLIPSASTVHIGVCSFLMLILNLVSFYFYEIVLSHITDKMEKEIAEEKNLYYAKQLETQTSLLESLRSYQHDMKNHAIVADAYFFGEDYEKLREYYYEVMRRPLLENKEYYSGNTVVDSLLNYKAFEAKKKGVNFEVKSTIPPELKISSSDLAIVLGNLMDNAIEAAAETEEKTVKVKLTYAHHCLMMKMENTFSGKVRKSSGRFLSTKENAVLHGYGLRNVKRIVDANGGTLKFSDENNIFTVTLLLHDNEKE
ncbi:MAG: sensor histidine kinase [Firmicutes bacterium]|nr:sensor histidine kinase [Bacillota bacterium]